MGGRMEPAPCIQCRKQKTRSLTRLCYVCKPLPDVRLDGDKVYVDGLGHLTTDKALRLAWAIADLLSP
jgi:hypothetical protein